MNVDTVQCNPGLCGSWQVSPHVIKSHCKFIFICIHPELQCWYKNVVVVQCNVLHKYFTNGPSICKMCLLLGKLIYSFEVLCISACFPWSDLPGISPSAVVSSDSTTMIIVLMTISSQDQRFRQVNQRDRQLFLWPDGGALLIFDIVTGHPQVSIVVSSRAHWPDIISD